MQMIKLIQKKKDAYWIQNATWIIFTAYLESPFLVKWEAMDV
jgi:hypothetical protein